LPVSMTLRSRSESECDMITNSGPMLPAGLSVAGLCLPPIDSSLSPRPPSQPTRC
jgi:hypothetical protein